VQRVQHELATTGTMTDTTWFEVHRTMAQLADEDLQMLIETLARTAPTLRSPDAGDTTGPGTPPAGQPERQDPTPHV
jgi:hypothetical protein